MTITFVSLVIDGGGNLSIARDMMAKLGQHVRKYRHSGTVVMRQSTMCIDKLGFLFESLYWTN